MPSFPLLDLTPPHLDASHAVRAPGGYEWWYFDAEDRVNHRQLVAIFFDGFVFHPAYLRADARFRRNPTRVRPAVPRDFPCVYFALYENGRVRRQFLTQFSPDQFTAARDRLQVGIGPNAVAAAAGSIDLHLLGTPWHLAGRWPHRVKDASLGATLRFTPCSMPAVDSRRFASRAMTGADHFWHIANPLCEVAGEIQIDAETIAFRGRGYHDHNFGTAPLPGGIHRWFWGRLLDDDSATIFHRVEPADPNHPAETHLIQIAADHVNEPAIVHAAAARERRTLAGLAYPVEWSFGDALTLRDPRVIDSTPFYLRLQYGVQKNGTTSKAFCEIAYPHRLRWPVLGQLIEMSIDKRGG